MPDKFKISTAVLAVALVYDMTIAYRNEQKYQLALEVAKALEIELGAAKQNVRYLANMLDQNEIKLTEFDKIALTSINS